MADNEKKGFANKLFGLILRNPFNVICILVIAYCSLQAFVLDNNIFMHKAIMTGTCLLWLLLFIAEHLFKLVLLIIAIACIFAGYLYWTGKDKRLCEENGGYWNAKIEKCEEKQPWWQNLVDIFKQ